MNRRRKNISLAGAIAAFTLTAMGAWWGASGQTPNEPSSAATATTPVGVSQEEFLVLGCNDGDTCRVKSPSNATLRIRLVGIDAPEVAKRRKAEKGQPLGLEAKDYLNNTIKGRKVHVRFLGTDPWDRNLGEIFQGSENVNLALIRAGMAEVYRGKPPSGFDTEPYVKAENEAKSAKRGVWGLQTYQSPKEFRKKNN